MSDYDLVLWIWLIGMTIALAGTIWYFFNWREMREFRHYLLHGKPPTSAPVDSIAGGWLRDAVFHLGLRALLVVFALERVALQFSIPQEQRGAFAASPLQLGLALLYLIILIWVTRWTMLVRASQERRRSNLQARRQVQ